MTSLSARNPSVQDFPPGTLVRARGRDWVVLPESTADLVVARPLNGDGTFVAGLFQDEINLTEFPPPAPTPGVIGSHQAALRLRTALQLGFAANAGPLRSLSEIAVTPRQYQLVPLLLALRQQTVRLLLGDDTGLGKTIEAGLIAKELLAQGDARGLAVMCSPTLAEQWRDELAVKFAIEAELVLPSTAAHLQRAAGGDSIFERYPFTIVSTDFLKQEQRRELFARTCPDLIIVDEAHTCVTSPSDGGQRQERYQLLRRIADNRLPDGRLRHLLLVTATPHSGSKGAFRELLGLLAPKLAELDLDQRRGREELGRHFIQRRRRDIRRYLDEETLFPTDRQFREVGYHHTPNYADLHRRTLAFARESVRGADGELTRRMRWWSALALLRSVASSPRAAAATFQARSAAAAAETITEADELGKSSGYDLLEGAALEGFDTAPGANDETLPESARGRLQALATEALALEGTTHDAKLATVINEVKALLKDGYDPIVFCRYIATAEYVADHLRKTLRKKAAVDVVTGARPPHERVTRINRLTDQPGQHVLVATDSLSTSVNLQEHFQAVIHYDLAWNPMRHEQRESRIDRFGQRRAYVRSITLYGADNGIDNVVLDVLIRKHQSIARQTGLAVPVPVRADGVLNALMEGLLLRGKQPEQLALDATVATQRDDLHRAWQSSADRESMALTKYAHPGVTPDEVKDLITDLHSTLGTPADVRAFVRQALQQYGAILTPTRDGFAAQTADLAPTVRDALGLADSANELVFHDDLPVPPGHRALVRTDPVVAELARIVFESALEEAPGNGEATEKEPHRSSAARYGVTKTTAVGTRTVLLLVRYRFHLMYSGVAQPRTVIAEDTQMLAYRTSAASHEWLPPEEISALLSAEPEDVPEEFVLSQAKRAVAELGEVRDELTARGDELAARLQEAHKRLRMAAGRKRGSLKVEANKCADVLGVYVFAPAGEML
ncbi:helicase [Nonomuraea sp. WAC 01424]|uniref:helicase-related protein n=1 Tax=Nonomuraea sp. WAC 01424 TaxID=2203200 RepID=UPI000F7BB0C9|nr:helicase-related protein [Nonomuraea sp. WAC 01424]RSM93738.1 helicase [Nonomuraea sp. WAC 01424]